MTTCSRYMRGADMTGEIHTGAKKMKRTKRMSSFTLSDEARALLTEQAKRARMTKTGWLEFLLLSMAVADQTPPTRQPPDPTS